MLISAVSFCCLVVSTDFAYGYTAELYQTDKKFASGAVVALSKNDQLSLAESSTTGFIGVAGKQAGTSVEVIKSGMAHVLVSDVSGKVSSGDRVGISPLKGVAAKHKPEGQVIGTILEDLSSASPGWEEVSYEGRVFHIARLPVQLGQKAEIKSSSVVTSLQTVAEGLFNKPVAAWRVVAALLVGLSGVLLAFLLVVSTSRQSFTSLGRNPMASPAILNGLWKIVAVALVIAFSSLFAAYLIASMG